jgi:hypothetical protein
VARLAGAGEHEVVDQGVRRARVAGDRLAAVARHVGHVGDTAEIEQNHRTRHAVGLDQRPVIDGHERRPLPARRDIGGAQIIDHR